MNLAGRHDHPLWLRPQGRQQRLDRWLERLHYTEHLHNPFGSLARYQRCVPSAMRDEWGLSRLGPSRHVWQPSKVIHMRGAPAPDQVFCWLHMGTPNQVHNGQPAPWYISLKYVIRREDWERTRFYVPWPSAQ